MSTQPPPPLDPLSIAGLIAGALLGQTVGPYVGAYSVILLGWLVGVLVGLFRRDPVSRMSTALFVMITFVMTVFLTVGAKDLVARYLPIPIDGGTLLFLIALVIPAVGDNWIDIAKWAFNRLPDVFSKKG